MAEFPALPLWTDSYLADTLHLSNAEHGVYLKFLMFAWRSPCCSLPDDDKRLARIAGVTGRVWVTMKPTIMAFWDHADGRYTQRRLLSEREFVTRQRAQQSAAGKASAIARALKRKKTGSTVVDLPLQRERQRERNPHTHTQLKSSGAGRGEETETGAKRPPLGQRPYVCVTCDKPRLYRHGTCEHCGAQVPGLPPADKPSEATP